jgi:predicted PurR-regulated permease PerM
MKQSLADGRRISSVHAKLPDYVVLISTLGGIEVFGLNGFVIGPLIPAIFMVTWEIFSASRRTSRDSQVSD